MTTVALYARISKDSEGRAEGVATQEKKGRKLALELWPKSRVQVFKDNDLSAANPGTHRPGYHAMLEAIRRGEVAEVVAAEQSRLTRQPVEWEELVVTLAKAGINRIHTYRAGTVEVGRSKLVGRILAAVDAEEVERTRARIHDKLDALAAEGRPGGGTKFGYRSVAADNGQRALVVDEEQAEAARWAAGAVLAGWSLTSLANKFKADGVRSSRGGTWTCQSVRSMLRSPTIAGMRVYRGEVVGRGTWEPILDEVTWRQVGAVLDNPSVVNGSNGLPYKVNRTKRAARRYLLTGGVARCGRCGAGLTAQQRRSPAGGRQPSYVCLPASRGGCSGVGIGATQLEDHVRDELLRELERRNLEAVIPADDGAEVRERLSRQLGDVEAQRTELAQLWSAGDLSGDEWATARKGLDERRDRLTRELADVPVPTASVDTSTIAEDWDEMTIDERRHIIGLFIGGVVVNAAITSGRRFDSRRVVIEWR